MVHTYQLKGMTCGSCESKVRSALLQIKGVQDASVSKDNESATITVSQAIALSELQETLAQLDKKYSIDSETNVETIETTRSWLSTYKPVLLIFAYIFIITGLIELTSSDIEIARWMRHFMAGFFLTFSFFKMMNLKGFKESYQMYDVIARRFPVWGYLYAFVEVLLGVAFLINFNPFVTNIVALTVMSLSIIGVLQSVLNKKVIKCACLGDVFNLPMSTVTIIEDGLMILMSASMLIFAM